MGQVWKTLSAEEKRPFEQEYIKNKAEYDQKIKAMKELKADSTEL